ncbi:hypothetical protein JOE31_001325 [Arthrobacter sp. PvP023]|uniref:hypothetical protein n=1 Tax=Micrococcaceae TaxID=1268 RepID=UPI001AE2A305|nr:hypothetical protein [Arthrobacter sp. PvP023]MBP1135093.1 hypothetical protein [Arthrobacter sp. PvP023]
MKILYVPNEWGTARQSGMRRAFATLVDRGLIEDVKIYSLLWRIRQGEGVGAARGLLEAAKAFAPDLILMQHLGGTGLNDDFFSELRAVGKHRMIYHEGDPYSRWKHRLPSEAKSAGRHSDVVFTVGKDVFRSNFLRAGSRDVRWCSSVFDPGRFGKANALTTSHRDFDVVMIANKSQARTPFTGHPNSRQREELVRRLAHAFGPKFAIYGNGWTGPSAQGPVDYSKQDVAIHSGWISTNWDHYAGEASYFSDRLPTTLATGSVHVTTLHPGFDAIFQNSEPFIQFGRSPKDVVRCVENLLSTRTTEDFIRGAIEGRKFADRHFRQDDQLVTMLNFDQILIDPTQASAAWDTNSRLLMEV